MEELTELRQAFDSHRIWRKLALSMQLAHIEHAHKSL